MTNSFGVELDSIKKGCLVNTTVADEFGENLGRTASKPNSFGAFKIKFSNRMEIVRFEEIRSVYYKNEVVGTSAKN